MARANDTAWETYIKKKKIRLDGQKYEVLARDLNTVAGDRARLMTKVDEPDQLPPIFRKAGYSILAVANGSYLLFRGNMFATIPDCPVRATYSPRTDFPLKTTGRGAGESDYLDNAFNTGLLSEFAQCGKLYLTIRGRERARQFDFRIDEIGLDISVNGVQIEVDAGFEGERDIFLIEGKIGNRSHFNIRQLYYPFRHFSQIVPNKNIRPLFFAYDLKRATYLLYEFGFHNPLIFDSIYPVNCSIYSLTRPFVYAIDELKDQGFETHKNIVPQADDLNKILELLRLINSGQNAVPEIADHFSFNLRQSNYYGEAAESLGLITRKRGIFELTERGSAFIFTDPKDQRLFFLKLVLNSWYFMELIQKARRKGYYTKDDIEELVRSVEKVRGDKRYHTTTIERRVRTVTAWSKWISEEFGTFRIDADRFVLK
jgi:hypothetical protein